MPAVGVTGLTVRYGPAGTPPAVDDVDLSAEAGEVLVVLGPNGAGKTSTVETLEGYRRPAAGEVRVLGLNPVADHAALTGRIGVMLQRGGVYPMLGPRRVLDLFGRLLPRSRCRPLSCSTLVGLARRRHHPLAPPLGGRAAAPLARPGAGRAPRGGVPRRAHRRRRPRGANRHPRRGGRAQGAGRLRRADHPRAGRGREDGRPHRDPRRGPRGAGGDAAELLASRGRRGRSGHHVRRARAGSTSILLASAVGPGTVVTETEPGRYRVEATGTAAPAVTAAVATFLAERGRHTHRPRGGADASRTSTSKRSAQPRPTATAPGAPDDSGTAPGARRSRGRPR